MRTANPRILPLNFGSLQPLEALARVFRSAFCAAFIVAALLLCVTGCGGGNSSSSSGGNTGGGSSNTGAADNIYVVQLTAPGIGTILEFPATASGSVSPTATITPGLDLEQVNTDQDGNIYIVTTQDIREYASGATGAATPVRTLSINTLIINGMAVSPTGEILIGNDGGDVDEWGATQDGNVAPERRIPGYSQTGGSLSPVVVANQVAIDGSDNLYIAPEGITTVLPPAVVIYGPSANGTVAPSRTVDGTGLVSGVTVDSAGNIYTAGEASCIASVGPPASYTCTGIISEYAADATATSAPIRTISGSATQLAFLNGIKVDGAGNIYVVSIANTAATPENPAVLKFDSTASGNVAPTSSFTSTAWTTPDFNPSIALH
jgi:sugar lactone lactonase YvrE